MIRAAETDREIGIEWYATEGEPCKALVRSTPDDFVVEERVIFEGLTTDERSDYYPVYRIEKRSIDTIHMAEELGRQLKSRVSYGGMKDKRAKAVQYATPTSLRSARPSQVKGERFTATLIGYMPGPLTRAAVTGNRFDLTLRECCPSVGRLIGDAVRQAEERRLPNYYGIQRFGSSGAGTHRIGKTLISKEFESAVNIMLLEGRQSDSVGVRAAREAIATGNYRKAARLLPPGRDVEKRIALELDRHPGDWLKALRAVPLKLRRLYVQAYQSLIFNKSLSACVANGEDISSARKGDNWAEVSDDGLVTKRVMGVREEPTAKAVPMIQIVGYAYRNYGSRFDACVAETMQAEGVTPGQFYVQEMQEVSNEGGFRRPHMALREAAWDVREGTAHLGFTLAKGQYATILLREIIKPRDPASSGLA